MSILFKTDSSSTATIADGSVTTAKLAAGVIDAMTAVTPQLTDYVSIADTSDSGNFKKSLVSLIVNEAVETIDNSDSPYTLTSTVSLVDCDATSGAITVNLPTSQAAGRVVRIIKTDATFSNAVTIQSSGAETIDGAANTTLNTRYESVDLVSMNGYWLILNRKIPRALGSLTTTGSFTTNSTYTSYYERDGFNLIGKVKIAFAGAPNSVSCSIDLPASLSADTAKMLFNTDGGTSYLIGSGAFRDSGVNSFFIFPRIASSTPTVINVFLIDLADAYGKNSGVSQAAPATVASGDSLEITYRVPISGWKA